MSVEAMQIYETQFTTNKSVHR